MALKPVCPKCGSIKVSVTKITGACMEPDCKHRGASRAFKTIAGNALSASYPDKYDKTIRRDPVAMSMDGYDD